MRPGFDAVIARETGTDPDRPLAVVMVIAPAKLPVESPFVLAKTVRVAGSDPDNGDTDSHDAPAATAVNVVVELLEIAMDCPDGCAPVAAEKARDVGFKLSVGAGFTARVCCT